MAGQAQHSCHPARHIELDKVVGAHCEERRAFESPGREPADADERLLLLFTLLSQSSLLRLRAEEISDDNAADGARQRTFTTVVAAHIQREHTAKYECQLIA